jgi:hypothetical protein
MAGLTLGAPLALADTAQPAPQIAAEHVSATTLAADHAQAPAAPQADDHAASTYAQREATHKDAANFHGGSVVVIGASGGALLVILILILLLV